MTAFSVSSERHRDTQSLMLRAKLFTHLVRAGSKTLVKETTCQVVGSRHLPCPTSMYTMGSTPAWQTGDLGSILGSTLQQLYFTTFRCKNLALNIRDCVSRCVFRMRHYLSCWSLLSDVHARVNKRSYTGGQCVTLVDSIILPGQ